MQRLTPALRLAEASDRDAVLALLAKHKGLEVDFDASDFVVAVADGRILSCGRLRRHADGALELASVATEPGHAGRGLAGGVVRALLDRAPAGEPVFALALAPGFFARHGFRETPRTALPASVGAKAEGMCASQPFVAMVRG